ncbi:MAG: lysophospholipid acyltransferase family protein [Desulfobacterales bacterium]|nr:lysophospholipid acyltransferase family protein [Desulfobacterales bacterium]
MKKLFYNFLVLLSKALGPWIFVIMSRGVAAGYFLLFPGRVAVSVRFYKALFPDRSLFYYLLCAWKQYRNFTSVFLDRYLLLDSGDITYTSNGREYLEAAGGKTGGIILMSHMGNWEIAAHLLKNQYENIRILLYMGIRDKEELEKVQKEDLGGGGVEIIAIDQDGGSPFDAVKGIQFLKTGGFVSLTGDIVWKKDQRTVPVKFLGHEVLLPAIPYVLALLSGAPLFIFFTFRTGKKQYHFTLSEPIYIRADSRDKRGKVIQQSARKYAGLLEYTLRRHPFEWYHFGPFLGPALGKNR